MADPLAMTAAVTASAPDLAGWMLAEQGRIFRLCLRMLGDSDEADSVTQDVFLKAYEALQKTPAGPDNPARWLTRVAVNACLDRLRSRRWQFWRKRPAAGDEELILAMAASPAPDAEAQAFARQIGVRLAAALDRLSDRQRIVFTLRHYDDCSLDEIARHLGLDVGTVKAHLARAIAKMREELKDLYALRQGGRS